MSARPVAAGFRAHLGSADVVILTGIPDTPTVVDRRTVPLRAGKLGFPYHAAADVPPEERASVIAAGMDATADAATDALLQLRDEVDFDAVGVVVGRNVGRIPLDKILESSKLFHIAEGSVYQQAICAAVRNLDIPLTTIEFGAAETHERWEDIGALRSQVGPPWRKDQRFAAVAAWVALAR